MSGSLGTGYACQRPPGERALREGILSSRLHEPGVCHACDESRRITLLLAHHFRPERVQPAMFYTRITGI